MAIEKRTYRIDDLMPFNPKVAPSLDLPGLITTKYYLPKDNGKYMLFVCEADKTNDALKVCPVCRSANIRSDGYAKHRLIHDCTRNNHRVDILFRPPRVRCEDCHARSVVPIPGIEENRQATTRLAEFLRTECFVEPFTVLSERSGFSVDTISNILEEEAAKLDADRAQHPLEAPRVLGIDEKHLGRDMRGTLVDIETGRLLDILPDNKQLTMRSGIMQLHGWDTNIQVVTTDMNNRYLSWLNVLLPNATVVVDKFHVMQDISQKVKTCRKALIEYRKELIAQETDIDHKKKQIVILNIVTKHTRLFNYNIDGLSKLGKLDYLNKIATIINEFPEFGLLYNLRYAIETMYQCTSYDEAEKIFDLWQSMLPPSGKKAYSEWCQMYTIPESLFSCWKSFSSSAFLNFKPYILNYFKNGCRFTNAATEGLNRLIDSVQSNGNGYSFPNLRAKCLYSSLVHERVSYSIEISDYNEIQYSNFMNSEPKQFNLIAWDYTFGVHWHVFTNTRKAYSCPEPNIYGNNDWIRTLYQPTDHSGEQLVRRAIMFSSERCAGLGREIELMDPYMENYTPTNQVELIGNLDIWGDS